MKQVFVCENCIEGILCGIYDAWLVKDETELAVDGEYGFELFCEYRQVKTSSIKAHKVSDSIHRKLSFTVWEMTYKTCLSKDTARADKAFRFLKQAFRYGSSVTDMLSLPEVYDVFKICRNVGNEAHSFIEFLRFSQMEGGILLGKIKPENDILPLIAPHFTDRFPSENWIIYDESRQKAALHKADQGWALFMADSPQWQSRLSAQTDEEQYRQLWKAFHKGIAIKERTNYVCQRGHLPLRYRPHMTEFQ